jgi:hypothetical protein
MSQNVTSLSITAPGFFGLNRQDSSVDLPIGFAQTAANLVIDTYGRLGCRKGHIKSNIPSVALGSASIGAMHELVNSSGTATYLLATGNNKLFKLDTGALVELTYGGGGVAPTIIANNWQIDNLNSKSYFFQIGHEPLVFNPAVSTTTYTRVSEEVGYTGTIPQCNQVISAWGRIWVAETNTDKTTLAFSDLLLGQVWTGGTSGTIDISKVWTNGADEIVAIAAHNNFLVIFGRRQILIYGGANDPSTMSLYDSIGGIGCYARDTVQNTGSDLIFMSNTGVRSLQRTIQEKSAPLNDISKNIRDHLMSDVLSNTASNIKTIYSDINAFYLITLPVNNETYCFDTRRPLEDGSFRVTTWSMTPTAYCVTRDKKLYMGFPGYIGEYSGYLDNTSTYVIEWYSSHMTLGEPNRDSILKKLSLVAVGGSGQVVNVYYGFDFSSIYNTSQITLDRAGLAEYGIAEYGIGEYSSNTALNNKGANIGGNGKIVQIGLDATVNGTQLSFQKIDLFAKVGKVIM